MKTDSLDAFDQTSKRVDRQIVGFDVENLVAGILFEVFGQDPHIGAELCLIVLGDEDRSDLSFRETLCHNVLELLDA